MVAAPIGRVWLKKLGRVLNAEDDAVRPGSAGGVMKPLSGSGQPEELRRVVREIRR